MADCVELVVVDDCVCAEAEEPRDIFLGAGCNYSEARSVRSLVDVGVWGWDSLRTV